MALSRTREAVLKELAAASDKLAANGLTKERRLALLRRQAELGDLRDGLAERARRKEAQQIPQARHGAPDGKTRASFARRSQPTKGRTPMASRGKKKTTF